MQPRAARPASRRPLKARQAPNKKNPKQQKGLDVSQTTKEVRELISRVRAHHRVEEAGVVAPRRAEAIEK